MVATVQRTTTSEDDNTAPDDTAPVGSNLANAIDSSGPPLVDDTDYATYSTFTLHTVTEDDLQRHVNQLRGGSAPG
ncbi:hypothetical protein J6590_049741 [Homalodisca vitripennis]|nr:hypothetical protein J6590_049741 [Homalodisca vitripennis]